MVFKAPFKPYLFFGLGFLDVVPAHFDAGGEDGPGELHDVHSQQVAELLCDCKGQRQGGSTETLPGHLELPSAAAGGSWHLLAPPELHRGPVTVPRALSPRLAGSPEGRSWMSLGSTAFHGSAAREQPPARVRVLCQLL